MRKYARIRKYLGIFTSVMRQARHRWAPCLRQSTLNETHFKLFTAAYRDIFDIYRLSDNGSSGGPSSAHVYVLYRG